MQLSMIGYGYTVLMATPHFLLFHSHFTPACHPFVVYLRTKINTICISLSLFSFRATHLCVDRWSLCEISEG